MAAVTRDEKIARARELRESGWSYARIGRELGVSHSCVFKWLNPERGREFARRSNGKRNAQKRAWEREHDRGVCPDCGGPMAVGSERKGYERCVSCWRRARAAQAEARRTLIADLYCAGLPLTEIARRLESTRTTIRVELCRMRDAGWDLPFRYGPRKDRGQVAA